MKLVNHILVIGLFFGLAPSSWAQVSNTGPVILQQPVGTNALTGSSVTFSVWAGGEFGSLASGKLKLWLRADTGIVSDSQRKVSQWKDQSGNGNDAFQDNSAKQPLIAKPTEIFGRPTVRFDGIQDTVNGDEMTGQGDVGISGAFTSYLVYSKSADDSQRCPILVGQPGTRNGIRDNYFYTGQMCFSAWANDYGTGFTPPTQSYRIWTDRLSSDLAHLEMYDCSVDSSNYFELSTGDFGPVGPGYYVGGLGPEARNFAGDIAEIIYFDGALSDADRLEVEGYLKCKYFQNISGSPISYQWQFDGTDIVGATNAALTVTNLQLTNAGVYTVIVKNAEGSVRSSNAVLSISTLSIVTQPQSASVMAGSNITFSVVADGQGPFAYQWLHDGVFLEDATNATFDLNPVLVSDAGLYSVIVSEGVLSVSSTNALLSVIPLSIAKQPESLAGAEGTTATFSVVPFGVGPFSFQWDFNGTKLANATNSTLVLTNLQMTDGGTYSVCVSNLAGVVTSSNATLTVLPLPKIIQQPTGQVVLAGETVAFQVGNQPVLPPVKSGVMALWLKADSGVVTNSQGRVSRWVDQAGTNDAFQPNAAQQPGLVNSSYFGGRYALRFDGIQNNTDGDYLQGYGDVGIGGDYTAYAVYEFNGGVTEEHEISFVGALRNFYAVRSFYIRGPEMAFTAWGNDYGTGFNVPTESPRIWTMRMSANNEQMDMFDTTATATQKFPLSTSSIQVPAPGYYVGGLGPETRNFGGDIAEIIYWKGALTEPDRLAVEKYLKDKYLLGSPVNATYQWQLNGVNVDGATNATLVISNAQPKDAGTYTVVLSNAAGSVTSSNAVLTVNVPPSISSQPESQTVLAGADVTFTIGASGTGPFSYQWSFKGAPITDATNASLSLLNVQPSAAGDYSVVVTTPYGSVPSSTATLAIRAASLQVASGAGVGGGTVTLPIRMATIGAENAISFSLKFDPSMLTFVSAEVGANAVGATIFKNPAKLSSGLMGISLALDTGHSFAAGTQEVALVTFAIAPLSLSQVTPIDLVSDPIPLSVVDVNAHNVSFTTSGGTVAITQAQYEGDVTVKPNGEHSVTIADWVEVGRLVTGLDAIADGEQFQRADCAPRDTLGNGRLTVADWVQTGRYAARLDTFTPAGGPTVPKKDLAARVSTLGGPALRRLALRQIDPVGPTNSFYIELETTGLENAAGFSIQFDPAVLKFVAVMPGSIQTARINVNSNMVDNGLLGITVGLNPGSSMQSGVQQLVRIDFVALSFFPKPAKLVFSNVPVYIEVVDPLAGTLGVSSTGLDLASVGLPLPALTITNHVDGKLITWPASASVFNLDWAPALSGTNWTAVDANSLVDADKVSVLVSNKPAGFFRLRLDSK